MIIPTPACAASTNTFAFATALFSPNNAPNAPCRLSIPCVSNSSLYSCSAWFIARILSLFTFSIWTNVAAWAVLASISFSPESASSTSSSISFFFKSSFSSWNVLYLLSASSCLVAFSSAIIPAWITWFNTSLACSNAIFLASTPSWFTIKAFCSRDNLSSAKSISACACCLAITSCSSNVLL